MLVVSNKHQHQGVGSFAITFAESYIKNKKITQVGIHTTEDNIPAQNLYQKCGYIETDFCDCTTADGVARKGYTYKKDL